MDKGDLIQIIQKVKETKAQHLDLSNKGIDELPVEIGELTWLKSIDLSYNDLVELPTSISNLVNLETLLLQRNRITKLPLGFGNLSKLKTLELSYNPMVKLPREVGLLINLENLDASFCELKTLPHELTNLTSLKHLSLEDNCLNFPPQKVVNRGLYAVMHFLTIERRKNEASRVMIQVFNMPEKIQSSFRQYTTYFSQMVSEANQKEVIFDMNFVNQDFYQEMDLSAGVEGYLYDIIRYIKEKVEFIKSAGLDKNIEEYIIEHRMSDMKTQLHKFSSSLDDKIEEIRQMKRELNGLYEFLDSPRFNIKDKE